MATPSLPVETWNLVAEAAPRDDLQSLALVSRALNDAVRPVLFRELWYCDRDSNDEEWISHDDSDTFFAEREQRISQRFHNISTHFARYVRRWTYYEMFIPLEEDNYPTYDSDNGDDDDRMDMIESNIRVQVVFLELLSTYPNLKVLSLFGIPLSDHLTWHLERLRTLEDLKIDEIGRLGPLDHPACISVQKLHLETHMHFQEMTHSSDAYKVGMAFTCDKSRLEFLRIGGYRYFCGNVLSSLAREGAANWTRLTTLDVLIGEDQVPQLMDFLALCPVLETLILEDSTDMTDPEDTEGVVWNRKDACPNLKRIESSSLFVIALAPGRPIKSVDLDGNPGESEEELFQPIDLLQALASTTATCGLRSLSIQGGKLDHIEGILNKTAQYLPGLLSLEVGTNCGSRGTAWFTDGDDDGVPSTPSGMLMCKIAEGEILLPETLRNLKIWPRCICCPAPEEDKLALKGTMTMHPMHGNHLRTCELD